MSSARADPDKIVQDTSWGGGYSPLTPPGLDPPLAQLINMLLSCAKQYNFAKNRQEYAWKINEWT